LPTNHTGSPEFTPAKLEGWVANRNSQNTQEDLTDYESAPELVLYLEDILQSKDYLQMKKNLEML